MFNLTVDEAHTFYVGQNGWLVHNASVFCDGVNLTHVFEGEINARSRATGFHFAGGDWAAGKARVDRVPRLDPRGTGAYEARVSVLDAATGTWKSKTSSMFPDHWGKQRVFDEIYEAFGNAKFTAPSNPGGNYYWEGVFKNGMKIGGYLTPAGDINTAFPIIPRLPR